MSDDLPEEGGLGFDVTSDGRTVWVTGPDGSSRARYGPWGYDVHHDADTQLATGRVCLACHHGRGPWPDFVALVTEHLGVTIGGEHRPRWAAPSAEEGR